MNAVVTPPPKRNRLTLLLLIGLFALPPLLGWVFILNPQWLPSETINKGTLITPPRTVRDLGLQLTDGSRLDWDQLQDKWIFTLVNLGDCSAACIDRLIDVRQFRRALAAERQRIARILILLPDGSGRQPAEPVAEGLDGMLYLRPQNAQNADRIRDIFQLAQIPVERQMFTIDPHGNLMMRHDLTQLKPKEILKDLELLLKASANWVTGEQ